MSLRFPLIHRFCRRRCAARLLLPSAAFAFLFLGACTRPVYRPVLPAGQHPFFFDCDVVIDPAQDSLFAVEIRIPRAVPGADTFRFATHLPGTYTTHNFGAYVRGLEAQDSAGRPLAVERLDTNGWRISDPAALRLLRYRVRETEGCPLPGDTVFLAAGTGLEANLALFNPHALVGSLSGYRDRPYRLRFHLPADWTAGTALDRDSAGYFYADDFAQLADAPCLCGRNLQRASFGVGAHRFHAYGCSEGKKISARGLRRILKPAAAEALAFLDSFPEPDYTFLFYSRYRPRDRSGALEHRRSSCYVFSRDSTAFIKMALGEAARHELFHRFVPLELCGDQMAGAGLFRPDTMDNLWFYEGVAAWAAQKMRVTSGALNLTGFLRELRGAILSNKYGTPDSSLQTLSRTLNRENMHRFSPAFYSRGMLCATLLDIEMLSRSGGRAGLRDVLLEMRRRYPPARPFADTGLIAILDSLSHSGIAPFLRGLVEGGQALPVAAQLEKIGVIYKERQPHPAIRANLGLTLGEGPTPEKLVIRGLEPEARHMGYQVGDVLVSLNGDAITLKTGAAMFRPYGFQPAGKNYVMIVLRRGEKVAVNAWTIPAYLYHTFRIEYSLPPGVQAVRGAWLTR